MLFQFIYLRSIEEDLAGLSLNPEDEEGEEDPKSKEEEKRNKDKKKNSSTNNNNNNTNNAIGPPSDMPPPVPGMISTLQRSSCSSSLSLKDERQIHEDT